MLRKAFLLNLGTLDYNRSRDLQKRLHARRVIDVVPDTVLLVEHPHTITLGRRGNRLCLKASPEDLERMGIPVVQVERGGDVTYHGPGQAVVYPILYLRESGLSLADYVAALESLVIGVLGDFGIKGRRNGKNRGVWVGGDKIASVGIAVSRWVSYHGIALNCTTDLGYFGLIDACGLKGVEMTSISKILGKDVSGSEVGRSIAFHLRRLFERDWQERTLPEVEALLND